MPEQFLTSNRWPIANRPQDSILPHRPGHVSIGAIEGHRLWAAHYDHAPNPLLSLEMRVVSDCIDRLPGLRVLDAGSGTGRWMRELTSRGAQVFGIDACREMILEAEVHPDLTGRSALADLRSMPLEDSAFDLALCSFALGYVPLPAEVFRELARVAQRVIVTDLHPGAVHAGWTRSFRAGNQSWDLVHYDHSIAELDDCAFRAGLTREWRIEASFGEPEREIFERAGKEKLFEPACLVPAVLASLWRR